ncbi:CmpA/NrtA family ABC transporter substrate-binding protein [Mariluticola halotolerans]|uniref:CmpA/NrtA family ABC transporter substrate-binding protein n=1 Tax=Mariluticola halotolerans TaxID=2909283 RepID=UPI0026E29D02|nr:CmpA/NrtA family ABC transporter substrate-binding protein [Mariluticola halotolerans]UJQ94355.1 ABC transporter substrate-binding protein [Mariluticola halotolerans]
MTSLFEINAGFLPLLDSALLVVAEARGFAAEEGLKLNLVKQSSWANIRDRLAVGHFDVAHMLAPMPIASSLGLNPLNVPTIAPMALGLGGNSVTVSPALWDLLVAAGAPSDLSARAVGAALKQVVAARAGGEKLRFGVVHPHSGHNYELRYWLAASGIHPDRDIEIVIVPPPLLPDALARGAIDGFCVGAPWNSVAVARGVGRIATVKAAIWRSSPEKVLGLTSEWARREPEALAALIRAVYRASIWCGDRQNLDEVAQILAAPDYLDQPADILMHGLSGQLMLARGEMAGVDDFFIPHARAATFPWQSHALWFYSQMVRWGQLGHTAENARIAAECYRPDLYRAALSPLGVPVPAANAKVEGALGESTPVGVTKGMLSLGPDGFFDGQVFDPDDLDRYIIAQKL